MSERPCVEIHSLPGIWCWSIGLERCRFLVTFLWCQCCQDPRQCLSSALAIWVCWLRSAHGGVACWNSFWMFRSPLSGTNQTTSHKPTIQIASKFAATKLSIETLSNEFLFPPSNPLRLWWPTLWSGCRFSSSGATLCVVWGSGMYWEQRESLFLASEVEVWSDCFGAHPCLEFSPLIQQKRWDERWQTFLHRRLV